MWLMKTLVSVNEMNGFLMLVFLFLARRNLEVKLGRNKQFHNLGLLQTVIKLEILPCTSYFLKVWNFLSTNSNQICEYKLHSPPKIQYCFNLHALDNNRAAEKYMCERRRHFESIYSYNCQPNLVHY